MSKNSGMKSCKKLERAGRQANHNQGIRLHKIAIARAHHIKNALQSCGLIFAEKLRAYYQAHPTAMVGKRAGSHLSSGQ